MYQDFLYIKYFLRRDFMDRARHAFGSSENLQKALDSGAIDAYDILFLDGDADPKVGWIDKNGNIKIVQNTTDLSGVEAELATKANAEEVDTKIVDAKVDVLTTANAYTDEKFEVAMSEHVEVVVEEKIEEKVTTKVEEAVESANSYTDAQIEAKMAEIGKVEIVEF
jgi:hypothetical protein